MSRQPTGNLRGRPTGTGRLGEQIRLTVRIPTELYARLEVFAEGRHSTGGTPQLSVCVRELLEHALACPQRREAEAQQREQQALLARVRYLEEQGRIASPH